MGAWHNVAGRQGNQIRKSDLHGFVGFFCWRRVSLPLTPMLLLLLCCCRIVAAPAPAPVDFLLFFLNVCSVLNEKMIEKQPKKKWETENPLASPLVPAEFCLFVCLFLLNCVFPVHSFVWLSHPLSVLLCCCGIFQ